MANNWTDAGLQWYLEANAAYSTDANLKVALMDGTFVASTAHSAWAGQVAKQVGSSEVLPVKSSAGGTATAGDTTFAGIAAGLTIGGVVLYHETGAGTGTIIGEWDTSVSLPLATTGADIIVHWNSSTPTGAVGTL